MCLFWHQTLITLLFSVVVVVVAVVVVVVAVVVVVVAAVATFDTSRLEKHHGLS